MLKSFLEKISEIRQSFKYFLFLLCFKVEINNFSQEAVGFYRSAFGVLVSLLPENKRENVLGVAEEFIKCPETLENYIFPGARNGGDHQSVERTRQENALLREFEKAMVRINNQSVSNLHWSYLRGSLVPKLLDRAEVFYSSNGH
ncbi:hypothetical protein COU54_00340 [Candidatus Pacearchaeota archaeon CG10_big_fil_rev_8_21_14_0_10_31_24]|nr:MAG: hypothetical protein COU54_00340 [Candidatus Pacearchaeota archaeon CG10_big_fil_rev_8_21_14_0_10_31_24]